MLESAQENFKAEFLEFALQPIPAENGPEWSEALEAEYTNLGQHQRLEILEHIRRVTKLQQSTLAHVYAVRSSPTVSEAKEHWKEASRRAAMLSSSIETLKRTWKPFAKSNHAFTTCLDEHAEAAQKLRRTANQMRQQLPVSELTSSAAFDAMMDREKALQHARAQRQQYVDCKRVERLESQRRLTARSAGIKAASLEDLDNTWQPIETMSGGMGSIRVWAQDDGHGRIVDRLVIKDTVLRSLSHWEASTTWYGDKQDRIPVEFWTHSKMDTGAKHILHLRSRQAQVDEEWMTYRMWLEYVPNGDLAHLIARHRATETPIPVEFIIYTFKALIDCCVRMERGALGKGPDDWEQIVHRDLKPENVFLGLPRTTFPCYPEPKLADFGLAMVTRPDDPCNPGLYNLGGGTEGYLPPEQVSFINPLDGEAIDDFKLLAPANVWGIGSIILCLLEKSGLNSATQPDYMPGGKFNYRVSESARHRYCDKILLDTVDSCLNYNPAQRPTPERLKEWITRRINTDLWLRDQSWGAEQVVNVERLIEPRSHRHYLGMSFGELLGIAHMAPDTDISAVLAGDSDEGAETESEHLSRLLDSGRFSAAAEDFLGQG